MNRKSAARLSYYEGVRKALLEHFEITEQGLRTLKDLKPSQIEKLIADVQKQHRKLLDRIDRRIRDEQVGDSAPRRSETK
jgi:hypothetical protein